MTQTAAAPGLSREAETRLDEYLAQMRAALRGVPDVSPDEVEADIREHVANELRTAVRPVAAFVLEAVLRRLGPPTQWLPAGWVVPPAEVPVPSLFSYLRCRLRGMLSSLWRGPEDWRLPYLAFAVFGFGVLAFPLFPLFLVISYLLARAGLAVARQKGIVLDAGRKWLLYPPLVIVSGVLFLGLTVVAPCVLTLAICENVYSMDYRERWELAGRPRAVGPNTPELRKRFPDVRTTLDRVLGQFPGSQNVKEMIGAAFVLAGMLSAWWAIFGLLGGRFPGAVRALFVPLCDGFGGWYAHRIGLACLLLFAIWLGFAGRILVDANAI